MGGVKGDPRRASKLFEKACDLGNADGCYKLGAFHDELGPVAYRDFVKSARAYECACKLGFAEGCVRLANAYRRRQPPQSAEASRLLQKACEQ